MKTLAGRATMLATAAMAAASMFLPQSAIPEPLAGLREFSVAVAILAVLLAWVLRDWLRTHVRGVLGATAMVVASLIVVHLAFVKPVHYRTLDEGVPATERVWFITGWAVTDPTLQDLTSEDLIRRAGGGWDELRAVWGRSFDVMALAYSGLYLLGIMALTALVFSVAGAASTTASGPHARKPPTPDRTRGRRRKKRTRRSRA